MDQAAWDKGAKQIEAIHRPYLTDTQFNHADLNAQDLQTEWERENGKEIDTATALAIYDNCLEAAIT